ncbi:hypothetical protein M0P98_08990 [bacterium]|nr:hypothetical protein [bacterium]
MNALFLDGHVESVTTSRFVEAVKKHYTSKHWWVKLGNKAPIKLTWE